MVPADAPVACPRPSNVTRAANRARQSQRLKELSAQHGKHQEGFLQEDFHVGESRHVIFPTPEEMAALDRARTWYLDGTFKIVKRLFYQLSTIHAFAKGDLKQVSLAYCFMGSRAKKD